MDPLLQAFADLHEHADVVARYRAVLPHTTVKGISVTDALHLVAKYGGRVDRSEVWLFATDHELLGPWTPIQEDA
jgi:hypothetical protein